MISMILHFDNGNLDQKVLRFEMKVVDGPGTYGMVAEAPVQINTVSARANT